MKKLRIIAFAVFAFLQTKAQNVGVNTDGSTPASTNLFEVKQTSTANNSVGGYFSHTGSVGAGNTGYGIQVIKSGTTGTNIGGDFSVSGAATTNLAGRFSATGATNNYALIVPSGGGLSGFGTSTPSMLLDATWNTTTNGNSVIRA